MPDLADVRRFALPLPETIEKPYFGMPGLRVQDKGWRWDYSPSNQVDL